MTRIIHLVGDTTPPLVYIDEIQGPDRPGYSQPTCRITYVPWQWFINKRPRNKAR